MKQRHQLVYKWVSSIDLLKEMRSLVLESRQWVSTTSLVHPWTQASLWSQLLHHFDPQLFKQVPTLNTMVPMVIEILQLRDKSYRNDSYVTCKCCVTREEILELGITYSVRKLKETPNEDSAILLKTKWLRGALFFHKLFFMDRTEGEIHRQTGRQTHTRGCGSRWETYIHSHTQTQEEGGREAGWSCTVSALVVGSYNGSFKKLPSV